MSRNNPFIILIVALLLNGCALKSDNITKVEKHKQKSSSDKPYKYDLRNDLYILSALDLRAMGDFTNSSYFFEKLYENTKDTQYLHDAIKNYIAIKNYPKIKELLDKIAKDHPQDVTANRYLVAYYIDQKNFLKAEELMKEVLKTETSKEQQKRDQELLAIIDIGLKRYDKALDFYEDKYRETKSEEALIKIANILYFHLNLKEKAIQRLQTHANMVGCSKDLCFALLELYQKEQDLNGLASIYKKLYFQTKETQFAKVLLELYAYQQNFTDAIEFLEESRFDESMLLELYISQKLYPKAKELVIKLYNQSGGDLNLLAREAMIDYEGSVNQNDPKLLKEIIKKFQKVVKHIKDPLYYNYYGYILIDHDIDVKKGMDLIQKALKFEPDSLFYLDSLAWGHYKLGNTKEAYKIIKPLIKKSDEPDILEHYNKIKANLKEDD
jgi:tetratricopeptide (TPR) repeat protein